MITITITWSQGGKASFTLKCTTDVFTQEPVSSMNLLGVLGQTRGPTSPVPHVQHWPYRETQERSTRQAGKTVSFQHILALQLFPDVFTRAGCLAVLHNC